MCIFSSAIPYTKYPFNALICCYIFPRQKICIAEPLSDVLCHCRMFSVIVGCSRSLSDVLGHCRMFSVIVGCSRSLSDVLYPCRMFSVIVRCSLSLSDVLGPCRMFSVIVGCSRSLSDVLGHCRMFSVLVGCSQFISVLVCSVSSAFRVPIFFGQLNIVSMYIHIPTICMYMYM